jgi:hypothetical protein
MATTSSGHRPPTFFTVSDARFFPGTVVMLNSLRLTGNEGELVVIDVGLLEEQRERLRGVATVASLDGPPEHPVLAKTTADLFRSGVVVVIDSDVMVMRALDDLVESARAGKIVVFPDHPNTRDRSFPEWEAAFELASPLRPRRYVGSGCLAVSVDRQPGFFDRWRRACRRLSPDAITMLGFGSRAGGPFQLSDQDALNALLMSEVPDEAQHVVPSESQSVLPDGLRDVEILDEKSLQTRYRGETPALLHYALSPKAWESQAWRRVRRDDAYLKLFPRVAFAPDVPVRLRDSEVAVWLRPRGVGRVAAVLVGLLNFVRVELRRGARLLRNRFFQRAVKESG